MSNKIKHANVHFSTKKRRAAQLPRGQKLYNETKPYDTPTDHRCGCCKTPTSGRTEKKSIDPKTPRQTASERNIYAAVTKYPSVGTPESIRTTGIISPLKRQGDSSPKTSLTAVFFMNLPTKNVAPAASKVAVVPSTISNTPLPKIFAIRQPIVSPITLSGRSSGKTQRASLTLNCIGP